MSVTPDPEPKGDRRRRWKIVGLLRWVVSLGLVGLLVRLVDPSEVGRLLLEADLLLLAGAVFFYLIDRLVMIVKWLPLLKVQVPEVSAARAGRAYFASSFAATFLPASVGADVLRTIGIGRGRAAMLEVGTSIVFERILGLIGSGIVALGIVWVAWEFASVPMAFILPWAGACAGAGLLAVLLPYSEPARAVVTRLTSSFRKGGRLNELLDRFATAYGVYRNHPVTVAWVTFLSVVEQLIPILVFWMASEALGLSLPPIALIVSVPLALFAARLPISVAGIGILEGGLVFLLGLFGVQPEPALSLAVVGRLVELVAVLPGAFWWTDLTGRSPDPR